MSLELKHTMQVHRVPYLYIDTSERTWKEEAEQSLTFQSSRYTAVKHYKMCFEGRVWWPSPLISSLRRKKQVEFQDKQGCREMLSTKTTQLSPTLK